MTGCWVLQDGRGCGGFLSGCAVDHGGVRWQHGSDDCATKTTDNGSDSGAGSPAAEKSMGLPRGSSDACASASTDAGSDEGVAQMVAAFHEFYAADILLLEGAIAVGLREHDGCAGGTDESAGVLVRGSVDDLNFLARAEGVQILPGVGTGLGGQRAGRGEDADQGQQISHRCSCSLRVAARIA